MGMRLQDLLDNLHARFVAALTARGQTSMDVADEVGVNYETLRRWVLKSNLSHLNTRTVALVEKWVIAEEATPPPPPPPLRDRFLAALEARGQTTLDVAADVGVHAETLRRWARNDDPWTPNARTVARITRWVTTEESRHALPLGSL